jgi:hypothetical protein
MRPDDIASVTILMVLVLILIFVLTRTRREQGTGRVPLNDIVKNVIQDFRAYVGSIVSAVRVVIWFVFIVAVIFGVLWLLVAVVKWMWQHS